MVELEGTKRLVVSAEPTLAALVRDSSLLQLEALDLSLLSGLDPSDPLLGRIIHTNVVITARIPESAMLRINDFQEQQKVWALHNFGPGCSDHPLLGMIEETGELSHSLLKSLQGIRGDHEKHAEEGRDAVGDVLIYLVDYCTKKGWSLEAILGHDSFKEFQATREKATDPGLIESLHGSAPKKLPCVTLLFEASRAMGRTVDADLRRSSDDGKVALASVVTKLACYCELKSWSLQEIVEKTWGEVSKRDWKKDPVGGGETTLQRVGTK